MLLIEWFQQPTDESFASYLELLSSDGLHVAFLADGEFVGDLGVCGIDLSPGEVVSILAHLCDQLVVTALLNDGGGDTCRKSGGRMLVATPR